MSSVVTPLRPNYGRHGSSERSARPVTAPAIPEGDYTTPSTVPPVLLPSTPSPGNVARRPRLQHKSNSIHTSHPVLLPSDSLTRPLPQVPEAGVAASPPPSLSRQSSRPLPYPPPSPAPSLTTKPLRPLPPRWASLRLAPLETSEAALNAPKMESSPVSMISPASPAPPSPRTIQRRRMAKLRRHLGESLPQEVVYPVGLPKGATSKGVAVRTDVVTANVLSRVKEENYRVFPATAEDLDESDGDDSSDESDMEESVATHIEQRLTAMGATVGTFQSSMIRRYSRKWVMERGGQRWVENDFQDILQSLREL